MSDSIQRFLFDNTDIRGDLVNLEASYQTILHDHDYPAAVKQLLGQFIAAATLLSTTIKFEGSVILQAKSQGQIPTIMAECSNDLRVRAIVRDAESAQSADFRELLKDGVLAITIEPTNGKRYQGIVSLEADSLATALEAYFEQSEQLSTRLWLCANNQRCAGMLLQQMPQTGHSDATLRDQQWEHFTHLAATITEAELLELSSEKILHRLYHQDNVIVFEPSDVRFGCSCSRQRTGELLRSIGRREAESIIADVGSIDILCEFCHHDYSFGPQDLDAIFSTDEPIRH